MTVAIAWIRKLRDCEELVFVTDSRLSGDGRNFDACPKILTLPRNDCAICFAGYTGHAYPMMLQLAIAMDSYEPLRRGSIDISTVRSHALKVFDGMADTILSSPRVSKKQSEDPGANFLFGGYSWIKKRFELWAISYSPQEERFVAQPAQWLYYIDSLRKVGFRRKRDVPRTQSVARIAFAGDQSSNAKRLLASKILAQHAEGQRLEKLDMQPFEVVRDMLRDPARSETIDGAPQIVKVYQYMRAGALGVYWPDRASGSIVVQGRRCLGYERIDRWVLDPDTLVSERSTSISHEGRAGAVAPGCHFESGPGSVDPAANN